MVHLVYCDDKAKALDKIMKGSKIMIVERQEEKSPTAG